MPKYFYLNREVNLVGQLGDTIYEIQDPSGYIKRGQIFSVAIAQVEVKPDEPVPESKVRSKKAIDIDAKL